MFDIGWSEMAVILLVALVVIGPRDLPRVARTMGRWVAKGRAMAREFQSALEDMAREAELDKVKSEIEKAGRTNLGKSIEKTIDPTGELGSAFDPHAKSPAKPAKDNAGGKTETRTDQGGGERTRAARRRARARQIRRGRARARGAGRRRPAAGRDARTRDRAGRSQLNGADQGS